MRLSRQFQFFSRKKLSVKKHVTSKSELTKQKQANKKQTKAIVFRAHKNFSEEKIVYFAFWCFFLKKLNLP